MTLRSIVSAALVLALAGAWPHASLADDAAPPPQPAPQPAPAPAPQPSPDASAVDPAPDGPAPHPLPRVVVEVVTSKGAISSAAIQAAARREFWGKAISCYRKGAYREQTLKINQAFQVEVAKGKARVTSKRKGRSKKSAARQASPRSVVEACVIDSFSGLEMPKGKRTVAKIRVRISPGDEPVAPPPDER